MPNTKMLDFASFSPVPTKVVPLWPVPPDPHAVDPADRMGNGPQPISAIMPICVERLTPTWTAEDLRVAAGLIVCVGVLALIAWVGKAKPPLTEPPPAH